MQLYERLAWSIEEAQMIMEGVFDPSIFKAIFLAGGSGSGKGYVSQKTMGGMSVELTPDGSHVVLTTTHGMKVVNTDVMLEILMVHHDISLDMTTHTSDMTAKKDMVRTLAKDITQRQMVYYLSARLGLVIDGTASDAKKTLRTKAELESLGYDTYMIFVNTDLETSLARNLARARTVPEDIVRAKWQEAQEALHEYKTMFGSNLLVVDNSGKGASDDVFTVAWKQIDKFTHKPISSPTAKSWIANFYKK